MLESVFFLNVEVFGVNDSVGERIRVFSVGNVELIFKNWFRLRPCLYVALETNLIHTNFILAIFFDSKATYKTN